jgi:hypothetical protein
MILHNYKGHKTKLRNEEICNMHSSPYAIRMINSRSIRWAGHVALLGDKRNTYNVLVRVPECINTKLKLKEIVRDIGGWTFGSGYGRVADFLNNIMSLHGFIKFWAFFDELSNC